MSQTPTPDGGLPRVALLGTGTMGAPMARTIAAAGLPLRVWNRTPERAGPLRDVATVAESVPEAVRGADVVLTMLHDADGVAEVMEESRGALGEETVWLQQSTVGLAGERRCAELAGALGIAYVDAPVLGTRKPAEDGALVVLAAGPDELRARVAPVLDAVGGRTLWLDGAGAGTRLKLAVNAWVATVLEGVAESLALTRDLGLDPRLFLDAVRGGAVDAPYVQLKGGAMLSGEVDEVSFALSGALKDVDLILAAAGEVDLELGLLPGVRDHLARAVDAGHGDKDMAATYLSH